MTLQNLATSWALLVMVLLHVGLTVLHPPQDVFVGGRDEILLKRGPARFKGVTVFRFCGSFTFSRNCSAAQTGSTLGPREVRGVLLPRSCSFSSLQPARIRVSRDVQVHHDVGGQPDPPFATDLGDNSLHDITSPVEHPHLAACSVMAKDVKRMETRTKKRLERGKRRRRKSNTLNDCE